MLTHIFKLTRPSVDTPWFTTSEFYSNYRKDHYEDPGLILSRDIEDSEDKLVKTIRTTFMAKSVYYGMYMSDPVIQEYIQEAVSHYKANNITTEVAIETDELH